MPRKPKENCLWATLHLSSLKNTKTSLEFFFTRIKKRKVFELYQLVVGVAGYKCLLLCSKYYKAIATYMRVMLPGVGHKGKIAQSQNEPWNSPYCTRYGKGKPFTETVFKPASEGCRPLRERLGNFVQYCTSLASFCSQNFECS